MKPVRGRKSDKPLFYFISHYYDADNPVTGGEKYNFRLVKALQKKAYPIDIYTDDEIPGIVIRNYLLYNLWFIFRLYRFRRSGILLIDSYMHPRLFIFLLFLKLFTRTRIIGTVHHLYWCLQTSSIKRWADKIVESIFVAQFDILIVPSEYTLKSVKEIVPRLPRTHIIHPGIDELHQKASFIKRQYIRGQQVKIIYVGGIQGRKGVTCLVHALNKVTYDDIILYLVGDLHKEPTYLEKVKDAINDHNLQDIVRLMGRVSNEELRRLYRDADIFVLPSYHEGYGIVVVEAMLFGLPIIASNVSSLPELVQDGSNGLLVPPGNAEALARAIDELSWSPEKRKMFGEQSLKMAQKANSWEKVEHQFLTLFN